MVLRSLASFICNIIGPRGHPNTREAQSYVKTWDVYKNVKVGGSRSPARTGSVDDIEGELCCVCLSRLKEGEDMRVLPCLHQFHKACVDRWFSGCRKTCPVCRCLMAEEEKHQDNGVFTEEMAIWFSSFHVAGF
ncbi:zf-RING_2 domain-containing protein [Cephalotus follicularis]|uniref:RING-type E3 ubiquitin transferase n=1 Tax=Cephalotus follicularis TaxID=3775 RepID=A0A1Q3C3B1_CEPFO|nr:zf-RING_2 domain-containing protein [Cephalotus follicularis]